MDKIVARKVNEVYFRIECENSLAKELYEFFSYEAPQARFHPKVKAGVWDGIIHMFDFSRRLLPIGVYQELISFCEEREYELVFERSDVGSIEDKTDITPKELYDFVQSLNLSSRGEKLVIRDYQYTAIYKALKNQRRTVLSPTGSGKSAISYIMVRYLVDVLKMKVLVVVPTLQLVSQIVSDYDDYASFVDWDAKEHITCIPIDGSKITNKPIICSTWQSLIRMSPSEFECFDAVIIDEVQIGKSSSIQMILGNCVNASMRFGLSGSLDKSTVSKHLIKSMLGPIIRVAHTRELIDQGYLVDVRIKAVLLHYPMDFKKSIKETTVIRGKYRKTMPTYQNEMKYLMSYPDRNEFIVKLVKNLKGNTLILFNYVETHGKVLYNMINEDLPETTYFVHGKVELEDREVVGQIMRERNDVICIASFGTFAAGINIPELNNIILASPTKSVVRLLQSIGRGLRKSKGKEYFTLYDIADDLSTTKASLNHTLKHFHERLSIYNSEEFSYTIKEYALVNKLI